MRLFPRKLKTWLVLTLIAGIVLLVNVFDWNYWARDPLVRYLIERSQRQLSIDDLRVGIDGDAFEPTVHLLGVRIDNAAWADTQRPMAVAGQVSFTFSWRSLVEWRPIVSRLTLRDADIELQRRVDGLRNWRLRRPDDRDAGVMKVMSLRAERSKVRFLHQGLGLDLRAEATPATGTPPPAVVGQPGTPLTQSIELSGILGEAAFSGRFQAPDVLTFLDTQQAFPLRGHLASGRTRIDAEGTVGDLFQPSVVDAALKLEGPDLAQLGQATSLALPRTRAYRARAQLRKDRLLSDYNFNELHLAFGKTEVSGELEWDPSGTRPLLHATLASDHLRPADWLPPDADPGAAQPLFSPEPLPRAAWQAVDAYVELTAKTVQFGEPLPPLQSLRLTAHLEDGALEITPLHFNLAGGQATARVSLNAQQDPLGAELDLTLRQLRVEKLLPELPDTARVTSPLNGQLRLKAKGRTLAELAGSADGAAQLTLEGGQMAALLEAKLALDGGKLVRSLLTGGERPVPLRCGVVTLEFRDGVGRTRQLWFETEQIQVTGGGRLRLREEQLELLLAPYSKDNSLLALNKPLRVDGPLTRPKVSISDEKPSATGPSGCKPLKLASAP